MDIYPLPLRALEVLDQYDAPAALRAHLEVVHDAAYSIVKGLQARAPRLNFDAQAVLFGAATHDIGKVIHPNEITAPGNDHEAAGRHLLLDEGIPSRLAKFAWTHNSSRAIMLSIEDVLVAWADTIWKGKVDEQLEENLASRLAEALGIEVWAALIIVRDIGEQVSAKADLRLEHQFLSQ